MKQLGILILAAAACTPSVTGMPPTVHPTARASQSSAGASFGAAYTRDESGNAQLVVPYGEGWARWGAGGGQLELHVLPGLGSVGYRVDLSPMGPGVGFALVPAGHAGLFYAWTDDEQDGENSAGLLLLGASVTGLVTVPSGAGFLYAAPRVAFTNGRLLGDQLEDADSVNLLTFGAAFGIDFGSPGLGTSLELSIQRSSNLDSDDGSEPLWIIAPTLGFRI